MKRYFSSLILLGFLTPGLLQATDFSSFLPGNLTFLIESRSIPEQRELWQQTPLYTSLQEVDWDALMQALDTGDEEFNADEVMAVFGEIRSTWNDLQAQLSDSFVFAVGDINKIMELSQAFAEDSDTGDLTEESDPELITEQEEAGLDFLRAIMGTFYIMADVKDPEAVRELLTNSVDRLIQTDEDHVLAKFEEDGIQGLDFVEEEESLGFGLYWVLEDNILLFGYTPETVRLQRSWIQSPPVDALARREAYLHTRENMLEDYHVLAYFPIGTLLNQFAAFLKESGEIENTAVMEKIWDWVDPDAMYPVSQSFRFEETRLVARSVAGFKYECGLQKLFLGPRGESAPKPSFAHKNFGSISSLSWSLPRFYEALESELPKIAPEASAALGMGRMMAAGQLGFDFKLQFLDHVGDGFVAFQTIDSDVMDQVLEIETRDDPEALLRIMEEHPTQGQYTLLGLELKNTEAIQHTLNILTGKVYPQGLPQPEIYRGENIYYPILDTGAGGSKKNLLTYTFLDNYLLIAFGDPNLLHMAIDADQDPELRIWNDEKYSRLRDQSQFEVQGQDFTSGVMLDAVMDMVKKQFISGFLAGVSMTDHAPNRETITRELSKIHFGIGASLRLHQIGDLEVRSNTVQEFAR